MGARTFPQEPPVVMFRESVSRRHALAGGARTRVSIADDCETCGRAVVVANVQIVEHLPVVRHSGHRTTVAREKCVIARTDYDSCCIS